MTSRVVYYDPLIYLGMGSPTRSARPDHAQKMGLVLKYVSSSEYARGQMGFSADRLGMGLESKPNGQAEPGRAKLS
jgi:hypothetical protein